MLPSWQLLVGYKSEYVPIALRLRRPDYNGNEVWKLPKISFAHFVEHFVDINRYHSKLIVLSFTKGLYISDFKKPKKLVDNLHPSEKPLQAFSSLEQTHFRLDLVNMFDVLVNK